MRLRCLLVDRVATLAFSHEGPVDVTDRLIACLATVVTSQSGRGGNWAARGPEESGLRKKEHRLTDQWRIGGEGGTERNLGGAIKASKIDTERQEGAPSPEGAKEETSEPMASPPSPTSPPPPAPLAEAPTKRKRGRPRKYSRPEDGPSPLGVVIATPAPLRPIAPKPEQFSPGEKRGRGRPPGSGKKSNPLFALPAAKVEHSVTRAAGGGPGAATSFTPRIITVPVGEDVAGKIMGFSQQGPLAVCVMSANGSISSVTLRHDSSFGGNTTYEGKYEILSLSGSFLFSDVNGTRTRSGGLSISLAAADGRVVGGSVSGLLVAATPVQIVVGSFAPTD